MKLEEHLDNLKRHIDIVRESCNLLGERLIKQGRNEMGVGLIKRGYQHDVSKFSGIEFQYLHNGQDVPADALELAIKHHQSTNDHHPEYWLGIDNMPEICVMEFVCDIYARSTEFGTGLRDWIEETGIEKYKIKPDSQAMKWINETVDLLLVNYFKG